MSSVTLTVFGREHIQLIRNFCDRSDILLALQSMVFMSSVKGSLESIPLRFE